MKPLRPQPTQVDVTVLAAELQRGDPSALDPWYRAEHPDVYRLCFGFLGNAEDAEDAAQDAMLHLHDHLGSWESSRPYQAWRNKVVLNLCRDRRRRIQARQRAEDGLRERPSPSVEDPSAGVEADEAASLLSEALAALTEREREVFVLRELEGLGTRVVGEMLEIGESSVRSLLTLARRRLRKLLGSKLAPEIVGEEGGRS